jgi:sterol 3beta-glucosyltransferase
MPKLTKEKLKERLLTITQDKAMINRAKLLGEAIRQENGTQRAMECLYRDMGLAKRTQQPASNEAAAMASDPKASLSTYASKLKHLPLFGMDSSSSTTTNDGSST